MAEQEIIKHTKKIYSIWNKKNKSAWEKIKDFFLEIIIIVFAVTLSIWLHDKSEERHQQAAVKEFLLGLKEDLTGDIKEMEDDKASYRNSSRAFKYITSIKMNEALSMDSITANRNWIFNATGLVPNNGRFEGFKSSGKIGTIENSVLQDNIMDLYQEDIPLLILSTDYYTMKKRTLTNYIEKNQKRETDSTSNLTNVLVSDESRNICKVLINVDEIISRYDTCINKMNRVISAIDKKYK